MLAMSFDDRLFPVIITITPIIIAIGARLSGFKAWDVYLWYADYGAGVGKCGWQQDEIAIGGIDKE